MLNEDVANSLNVVRQTVSKWEKGISIPDADSTIQPLKTTKQLWSHSALQILFRFLKTF